MFFFGLDSAHDKTLNIADVSYREKPSNVTDGVVLLLVLRLLLLVPLLLLLLSCFFHCVWAAEMLHISSEILTYDCGILVYTGYIWPQLNVFSTIFSVISAKPTHLLHTRKRHTLTPNVCCTNTVA